MTLALLLAASVTVLPPGTASQPSLLTVSFSSQGAEALQALTGKKIRGVGLESVMVCSTGSTRIPVGFVYQSAIEHGIGTIDPDVAVAMINRKVGFSLYNILPDVVSNGVAGVAVLGAAKVISMTAPWLVGLTAATGTLNIALKQFRGHAPDPTPLFKSLLNPESVISFDGAQCHKGMIVDHYKGKKTEKADGVYPL